MADHPETKPETEKQDPSVQLGHETSDVNIRTVAKFGLILLVSVLIIQGIMIYLQGTFEKQNARLQAPPSPQAVKRPQLPRDLDKVPEPRLQIHETIDLRALRDWEDSILNGYGWVDQKKGTVRIPIESAFKLLTERDARKVGERGILVRPQATKK